MFSQISIHLITKFTHWEILHGGGNFEKESHTMYEKLENRKKKKKGRGYQMGET
jgi:hypothetical protein